MAPYCAIPRDYFSDTPLREREHAKWRCDTPPQKGISAIFARYHMKTRQMGAIPPSAILSGQVLRDMGGYLALGR